MCNKKSNSQARIRDGVFRRTGDRAASGYRLHCRRPDRPARTAEPAGQVVRVRHGPEVVDLLAPRANPWLLAATLLAACSGSEGLYADGADYWTEQCTTAGRQLVASRATEILGEGTRDFALLDRYGYRVRLTDFCGNSVLLVLGDMSDPDVLDWIDELPGWLEDRDPRAPPLVILTAWFANLDGEVPGVGDLRRFAEVIAETRGSDPFEYTYTLSYNHDGGAFDYELDLTEEIGLIRDPYRFEDAAAAASVMNIASDIPEESRRSRREQELASRWGVREGPYFVALEPTLLIQALGDDPVEDGIIEALQGVED